MSSQFVAELLELARSRIHGLTCVILIASVFGFLHTLLNAELSFRFSSLTLLVPTLIAWSALRVSRPWTLRQLRGIEIAVLLTLCLHTVVVDYSDLMRGARELDVARVVAAKV